MIGPFTHQARAHFRTTIMRRFDFRSIHNFAEGHTPARTSVRGCVIPFRAPHVPIQGTD